MHSKKFMIFPTNNLEKKCIWTTIRGTESGPNAFNEKSALRTIIADRFKIENENTEKMNYDNAM